jgi:hypothetical protein
MRPAPLYQSTDKTQKSGCYCQVYRLSLDNLERKHRITPLLATILRRRRSQEKRRRTLTMQTGRQRWACPVHGPPILAARNRQPVVRTAHGAVSGPAMGPTIATNPRHGNRSERPGKTREKSHWAP